MSDQHTKEKLVPKWAGKFDNFQQWVNKAQSWLASPNHRSAMCVDALGRRCASGADMMLARDEGAFPVYFFWECEPIHGDESMQLAAARALLREVLTDYADIMDDRHDVKLHRIRSYLDASDKQGGGNV